MERNKYIIIALAFLIGLYFFEYNFLLPKSEAMRESIKTSHYTLQKYRDIINETGTTEEEMQTAILEIDSIEKKLIDAKNELFASAALQSEISDLARKANLRIETVRPLAFITIDKYSAIPIYFEGNGDIKQIGDFLRYVESSSFMIKIDKIHLNITNIQNPLMLKFKMQVSGLVKT